MRLAFVGCNSIKKVVHPIDRHNFVDTIIKNSGFTVTEILTSDASAPELWVFDYARDTESPLMEFPKWKFKSRRHRDLVMIDKAQVFVCVWDGRCKRCKFLLWIARRRLMPTYQKILKPLQVTVQSVEGIRIFGQVKTNTMGIV